MARNDFIYIQQKINHLRRVGLVTGKSTGIGFHGGAIPDWLFQEQKAKREKQNGSRFVPAQQVVFAPLDEAAE